VNTGGRIAVDPFRAHFKPQANARVIHDTDCYSIREQDFHHSQTGEDYVMRFKSCHPEFTCQGCKAVIRDF